MTLAFTFRHPCIDATIGAAVLAALLTLPAWSDDQPAERNSSREVAQKKSDTKAKPEDVQGKTGKDKNESGKPDRGKPSSNKAAAKSNGAKQVGAKQAPNKANAARSSTANNVEITPEREASVQKFVEQNHPELGTLLLQLKESDKAEYERAMRDLYRVSEQLANTHQRDLQRYEWELKRWQAQSRVNLLVARLQMAGGDELKGQLREALDELYSTQQSMQRLERERLAERLKKLDAQLATADSERQEVVDRQLRTLTSKAENLKKRKK